MIRAKQGMLFAGLTILMLGCQTQVIGGGTGGDGGSKNSTTSSGVPTSGNGGSGGVTTGPTPLPDDGPAIAMLFSELPESDPGSGSSGESSVATGGSTIDPNTLFLFVSNGAQSCLDPYSQPAGCVARYQVAISLPPSLQAVGTYPLTDIGFVSITEPGGSGTCSGGGGSYWDGTINITSIDAANVTFTLAGTASVFLDPNDTADGTYTAKRCF